MEPQNNSQIFLLIGRSGAGKSLAMKCLEDSGFYCIDNLPLALTEQFLKLCQETNRYLVAMALRFIPTTEQLEQITNLAKQTGFTPQVIYLDAQDETIIKRYSASRRRHPYQDQNTSLQVAITREKELLDQLEFEDYHKIDTTKLSPHDLQLKLRNLVDPERPSHMTLRLTSFGFKHGVPTDIDMIIDVRFLRNPYYETQLRQLTGCHQEVQAYVLEDPKAQQLLEKTQDYLSFMLSNFESAGKTELSLAIGCTGGHHRSITVVEKLAERFQDQNRTVYIHHRDIHKGHSSHGLS